MTTPTTMTAAELDKALYAIKHASLRLEVESEIGAGRVAAVRRYMVAHHANPSITVETVVVVGRSGSARAGQITNGDAVWGDWDAASDTFTTDDGIRVHLDGREEE